MENNIIKRENILLDKSSEQCYTFKIKNYVNIGIIKSPFGNCQIFAIKFFYRLLINSSEININKQLQEIAKKFNRPICMCDIEEKYIEVFKSTISKDAIMSITPYVSTNFNKMNTCMINTQKL